MSKFDVTVTGIADVNRILREIAPKEARNLLRATVHDIAGQVAKGARELSPDRTGLLDKSIRHRREKGKRNIIQSSVRVARPAFYWRFLERGQGPDRIEHAFFLKTLQAMRGDIDRIYLDAFVKKLVARLARLRKRG